MAKKPSRTRKKARKVRLSPTQMMQPGQEQMPGAGPVGGARGIEHLREEYSYVAGDLKRALALGALILTVAIAAVLALS
jgi:hypothetical protein